MTASLAVWALLAGTAALLWALSHAGTKVARPGALTGALVARPAVRMVVALVWVWVGWHLFAR
jgi:hypothetical protein